MSEHVVHMLSAVWDWLQWLLNSNFIAALAGALAGAISANRITLRKERKTDISNLLRDTNSAITLAGMIANRALSLKGQHVLELHRDFALEEVRFHEAMSRMRQAPPNEQQRFVLKAELYELPEMHMPVGTLATLVFDKIRIDGRPLGLMLAIENALQSLNLSIARRNRLCDDFRTIPDEDRVPKYLGLPHRGNTDQTYPHSVFHIYESTNDLAFFSAKLSADLMAHGKKLAKSYAALFGGKPPHVNQAKFDTPRALELMPPEANYSDFLSMFQVKSEEKKAE